MERPFGSSKSKADPEDFLKDDVLIPIPRRSYKEMLNVMERAAEFLDAKDRLYALDKKLREAIFALKPGKESK